MWPDQLKITENIILLSAFGVNINLKNKGKMLLIKLRQKDREKYICMCKTIKKNTCLEYSASTASTKLLKIFSWSSIKENQIFFSQ